MRRGLKKCWIFSLAVFLSLTTILARVPPDLTVYAQSKDVEVSAVDLDGNSLGQTVSFAGGDITEATAPKIEGKRFIRAYVIDSVTNKKEAIQSIESRGGRAYIKRINESVDALERSYLSTDTASKVYFEYLDLAKTVTVTYQPEEGKDIIVTGPPHLELVNGSAVGYFTVSVPRNAEPILDENIQEVVKDSDLSTTTRTVYHYKINTARDLTISLSSQEKSTLTLTANKTISDDWTMAGSYPNENYFYSKTMVVTQNVTDDDIQNGRNLNTSSYSFQYGQTVHLKAYSDRTIDRKDGVFSTFLSTIWLNDQPFGVPQPFSRFGLSKYPTEAELAAQNNNRGPYDRPFYEGAYKSMTNVYGGVGFENRGKLVPMFTRPEGFDSYWRGNFWYNEARDRSFRQWYSDVVMENVIGQTTVIDVDHGPLAGARITIKIMDAKTDNYTDKLLSWEYDEKGNIKTDINYLDPNKFNHDDGWGKGSHNSLRLAYDIQIDNAPTNITARTEWATTASSKIGMYLNYGVENVEVYASKPNQVSTPEDKPSWQEPESQNPWFNTVGMGGASRHSIFRDDNGYIQEIADPQLKIRGNVKNGYTSPKYRDDTVSAIHGTEADPNGFADPVVNNTEAPGKGFYGKYPVYSQVGLALTFTASEGYVKVAGMNVVGVEAELLHLPVDYSLNGGVVQNREQFPDENASRSPGNEKFMYDVEGNPIIHIPIEVPTKENARFLHWNVLKVKDGQEIESVMEALPGEDLNLKDIETFGRISNIDGSVNFDMIRLKAVFEENSQGALDVFTINHVYKENEDSEQEDGSETVASFVSIHGSDSSLTESGEKKFAPDKLEYNGNKYKLVLSDDASPKGGYTTFTDTSTSTTFMYVRTRGTVKVRYEDTEGNLLPDTNEITLVDNGLEGTEYESTKEEFSDYVFVDMKEDSAPAKGTVQEGDQTVVYVYRPKVKVPNTGLDVPMGPTLAILLDAVLATGIFLLIRRKRRGL